MGGRRRTEQVARKKERLEKMRGKEKRGKVGSGGCCKGGHKISAREQMKIYLKERKKERKRSFCDVQKTVAKG